MSEAEELAELRAAYKRQSARLAELEALWKVVKRLKVVVSDLEAGDAS